MSICKVLTGRTEAVYSDRPPFHPDTRYPELGFSETTSGSNHPYELFRNLLTRAGYDADNYGRPNWNPLGQIITPGQTVLLKPNYVVDFNSSGDDIFAVVTHPSILRAIIDYVYLALKGDGRIIIADAPQMDCNWDQLMEAQRIDSIQAFYRSTFGFNIELYDLRNFAMIDPTQLAYSDNRVNLKGDPLGSAVIDLGRESRFYGLPSEDYFGADFDRDETIKHHHGEVHEYCVSKTVLSADVFISVPKMKVHKKVGVTLNLKGLVGINTNKNYLIHYRVGTPSTGGDQLPDNLPGTDRMITKTQRWLFDHALAKQNRWGDTVYKSSQAVYRTIIKPIKRVSEATLTQDAGNWYGNDSAWRMTADLARVIAYADAEGRLRDTPQRRTFCVIDGIIGGENDGPLAPTAKPAGCLTIGENPLAVDLVTTRLMGFDNARIRQFDMSRNGDGDATFPGIDQIQVVDDSCVPQGTEFFDPDRATGLSGFKPHAGWIGHIEI